MRKFKKLTTMFIATLLLVCFLFPTTASAVTSGQTFTPNTDDDYHYYKVTVDGEGYVTLTSNGYANAFLTNARKESMSGYTSTSTSTTTIKKYAVSKGTYYIKASNSSYKPGTVNYKFTAITQKTNYCKAKAIALSKDKLTTIYQTPNYHFARWYKITLSSSQVVTIYNKKGTYNSFYILDKNGIKQNTTSSSSDSYYINKTSKLAAGTYYIYIPSSYGDEGITIFKWK